MFHCKKILLLTLAAVTIGSFAGCGTKDEASAGTSPSAATESYLDKAIVGTWMCDTDPSYIFTYTFEEDGTGLWVSEMTGELAQMADGDTRTATPCTYYMKDGRMFVNSAGSAAETAFDYSVDGNTLSLTSSANHTERIFTRQ